MVEALWLFIIQELRTFGVNLESIHKVKSYFFEDGTGKALPLIQFYLVFALQLGRPIYLVVLPDGHTECLDYGQYKTALALELLNTHITICLNELLSKLKVHAKKVVYPLETELNLEMHQLFEKIKEADFDTATIHRKNGKIDRVELKSQKNPHNRVHDALNEGDNLDITIKKRNGRIICCNSTTIEKV